MPPDCRAEALKVGVWLKSDGTFVRLCKMHNDHLVNAMFRALLDGESEQVTRPLAAEIKRRRLVRYAVRLSKERS